MLIVLTCVLGWWGIGAAAIAYLVYRDPKAFRGYYGELEGFESFMCSLLGPLMGMYVLLQTMLRAADTARVRNERIAKQLQLELAAANREIEALLKGRRV